MAAPAEAFILFRGTPPFDRLPESVINSLADSSEIRRFERGQHVFHEGDEAVGAYVIASGTAEIQVDGMPLAAAGAGECFGEVGLLTRQPVRNAGVVATSFLETLFIDRGSFQHAAASDASFAAAVDDLAVELARARLVREAGPFASLDDARRRTLARNARRRDLEPGEVLFRKGDEGDECYIVVSGRLDLMREDPERIVASVGPGTLLGETAVLTGGPRSATATAGTPVGLLAIGRGDLERTLADEHETSRRVLDLVRLRFRPIQAPGIEVHHRRTPDGDTVSVLKDPRRYAYFRLSEQGRFVWERLDGDHNVKDLALEAMERFRTFAPGAIADLIASLEAAGFVEGVGIDQPDLAEQEGRASRFARLAYSAMTWTHRIARLDAFTTAVYRFGGRGLFTPVAQVVLAVVALAGPFALAASADRARASVGGTGGIGWALLVGFVVAATIHDGGHALATKHYGREVRGGIGVFWFSPIIFIDTSDMWLAPRWQRIVVTLAGPYAHLITAGVAGLATLFVADGWLLVVLWEFTLFCYADVLLNLSPLLELDGYYLLVHVLDRPNLRRRSLAFLARTLPQAVRSPGVLRGHLFEVGYGVASLLFIVVIVVYSTVMYRLGIEPWLERVFSADVARWSGWAFVGLMTLLAIASMVGDVQRAVAADQRRSKTPADVR